MGTTGELRTLGSYLFDLIIPPEVKEVLSSPGIFLEIGMDEALLKYPWELMHDDAEFYCLKHYVGRFINSSKTAPKPLFSAGWRDEPMDDLSLLLIAVPNPVKADFSFLAHVDREANAIAQTVSPRIKHTNLIILSGKDATLENVFRELSDSKRRYHIVHFCGYAEFNEQQPHRSGLWLYDQPMTTAHIRSWVAKTKPIYSRFIEFLQLAYTHSTASTTTPPTGRQGLLGDRCLPVGQSLECRRRSRRRGSRVSVPASLVLEGKSMGESVRDARIRCKEAVPYDFTWASYIFYEVIRGSPSLEE